MLFLRNPGRQQDHRNDEDKEINYQEHRLHSSPKNWLNTLYDGLNICSP
jgi:hypothetical protein